MDQCKTHLMTTRAGLMLTPLTVEDADAYFALVQASHEHLTAFGDYREEVEASLDAVREALGNPDGPNLRFGLRLDGELIGRIDLVAVDPPRYGMGYWLGARATGKGYMTAAVAALVEFAREQLGATDVFAGVTHGNVKSVAVLERLEFRPVTEFERYTRFHLAL